MFSILMAALVAQAASAPTPVADVRQVSVTERKVIVEIDTNKVQGTPVGLAWTDRRHDLPANPGEGQGAALPDRDGAPGVGWPG